MASFSARLIIITLMKMYHQEIIETINKIAITNCTGKLAPVINVESDKSAAAVTGKSVIISPI